MAGRCLMKNVRGTVGPFKEVEIAGLEIDNLKCRTWTICK